MESQLYRIQPVLFESGLYAGTFEKNIMSGTTIKRRESYQ
jgi:hypothetical protein